MARPTSFTQEIADAICEKLADGKSLRSICEADDMPSKTTVFNWLLNPDRAAFFDQYTRARELQADKRTADQDEVEIKELRSLLMDIFSTMMGANSPGGGQSPVRGETSNG